MAKSFYCDNCGESVNSKEERCPNCGRFFRAVKCPVCSYSGNGSEFDKGCPVCGYLSNDNKSESYKKRNKNKSSDFLNISKVFAFSGVIFLSILLIYFLYLFIKI